MTLQGFVDHALETQCFQCQCSSDLKSLFASLTGEEAGLVDCFQSSEAACVVVADLAPCSPKNILKFDTKCFRILNLPPEIDT